MVFSDIPFLFFFLPVLLIIYFIVPDRAKNAVLLIFSLLFYAVGEPFYIFLMLFSITQSYIFTRLIALGKHRKLWLTVTVLASAAPLIVCKYADFFITNINFIPGISIPQLGITMPIGISFYTFQLIGYSVDVYRGKTEVQRNIFKLALYVSLFPQLIAGPIVRYADVERELTSRRHTLDGFYHGTVRFAVGLGKKILIANTLGELIVSLGDSSLGMWVYMIAVSLQIYYDFSGYSDMAIGLGKIFGFTFNENFNYPYISSSISEFWRRWHMSLGSWFRDYVYIPLGGNRVKFSRWIFNILVVWMLTGFWHGAEWNFIAWGLYYAVLLVAEKLLKKYIEKIPLVLRHTAVLFLVGISFVLFDSPTITDAVRSIVMLFDVSIPTDVASVYYVKSYFFTLAIAAVGATPLIRNAVNRILTLDKLKNAVYIASPIFTTLVLIISAAYIVDGSYNPFLYFRF